MQRGANGLTVDGGGGLDKKLDSQSNSQVSLYPLMLFSEGRTPPFLPSALPLCWEAPRAVHICTLGPPQCVISEPQKVVSEKHRHAFCVLSKLLCELCL